MSNRVKFGLLNLLTVNALLFGQAGDANAQAANPFTAYSTSTGSYFIGPRGTITFCLADTIVSGSGVAATIQPVGKCIVLQADVLSATDKWQVLPISGSSSAFFLDETSGWLIQCSVLNLTVSVNGINKTYLSGKCANVGAVTP